MTKPRYADDADLTIRDAVGVVEHIAPSNHVALVTHGDLRRPEEPRYGRLATEDNGLERKYVEQYRYGGHVTQACVERLYSGKSPLFSEKGI